MTIDVRAMESAEAAEFYITAVPSTAATAEKQAEEVFSTIRDVLRKTNARLFEERIFAAESALKRIGPIRARIYGDLDDGVPPTRLIAPQPIRAGRTSSEVGAIAGVHVHAIRGNSAPAPLRLGKSPHGRWVSVKGRRYAALSGLSAPRAGSAPEQARKTYEKAEAVLKRVGADMRSVARTWVWLDDILSWYGDFNRARSRFFLERGLLDGKPEEGQPPASTGIGVSLAGGARCGLDLIAVFGPGASLTHYRVAGTQGFAYKYGSAFSRASSAPMPAGETIFVSGTAAIDAHGATQHIGDARAQIRDTIAHVRAVLKDMNCTDQDVVQATVYCKTAEIEAIFRKGQRRLVWPHIMVISDICRDDLLVEIEATACPGARKLQMTQ